MNKEEILAKSRRENRDEGMIQADNQGRHLGFIAFSIIFIIVLILNLMKGQNSYAAMSMYWAFLGAESYPKYKFTKQRYYLISTIACSVASICFLASFLVVTLR